MNAQDKNNFAAMLSTTMQTFLVPMTPGMVDVWWNVLERYEFTAVRKAMSDHIQSSAYAPKPAEILARVRPVAPAYQPAQLEHKPAAGSKLGKSLRRALKPRTGQWWAPERVRNQEQVDFIKRQADHFGEMSEAGRFLTECQAAGIITADYMLGTLNVREPGEDTEDEIGEAA